MIDEMLLANESLLPQYADEMSNARKRLRDNKVPYRPVKGFTLQEKTVQEMAAEKEKFRQLASATEK